jgi:hypothetical protein
LIIVVTAVGAAARGTHESAAIRCGEPRIGGVVEVKNFVGRWARLAFDALASGRTVVR